MARYQMLPHTIRAAIRTARKDRRWSQSAIAASAGLTQKHVSQIESGKIMPRFDTLLEVVRVLDLDLVLVPRSLTPTIDAMVHDLTNPDAESAMLAPMFARETSANG